MLGLSSELENWNSCGDVDVPRWKSRLFSTSGRSCNVFTGNSFKLINESQDIATKLELLKQQP